MRKKWIGYVGYNETQRIGLPALKASGYEIGAIIQLGSRLAYLFRHFHAYPARFIIEDIRYQGSRNSKMASNIFNGNLFFHSGKICLNV